MMGLGRRRGVVWLLLAGLGMTIHVGTAFLRLNTFWPYPKLVDFGAFYAGAWALTHGLSPYAPPPDFPRRLAAAAGLTLGIPALNSFPVWPWLLQPFAHLPFPVAAWLWLLFNLGLAAWCTARLAELARVPRGRERLLLYGLVLTFGPVTLSLTLGQTGVLLLALMLAVGRGFARSSPIRELAVGGLWIAGIATKLFPLLWLPGLACLRRWPPLRTGVLALASLVLLHVALLPRMTWRYLTVYLPAQASVLSRGSLDDQSLLAWLLRLTQPMHQEAPGLWASQRHAIQWTPPFTVDPTLLQWAAAGALGLLSLWIAVRLWRSGSDHGEAGFYVWILLVLLLLPHTERYNHTLLLPAMAWLWGRGVRGRRFAVAGYFLAGLARLTHLWVLILPWPWASLMTGAGVVAVLLLLAGLLIDI